MSTSTVTVNTSASQTASQTVYQSLTTPTGFSYAPSIPIVTITGGGGGTGYSFANIPLQGSSTNNVFKVASDAVFDGTASFNEVTIKGKSLTQVLDRIEERLAILHPNIELESRWEDLADLRMQYVELEREIIEKEKVWAILNK
jgi:hypothetical protein